MDPKTKEGIIIKKDMIIIIIIRGFQDS